MTDKLDATMNQFILETEYPSIDEFEIIFQNLDSFTQSGANYDTTEYIKKNFDHVTKWVEDKCQTNKIPIKNLKISLSSCIAYGDGQYQPMHNHEPGPVISVVFYLDGQTEPTYEGKDIVGTKTRQTTFGMLYTIMPQPDGTCLLQNHIPKRGQCIILDSKVFHGVYPVKGQRRTVVVDFDFEYLDPDEKI